MSEEPTSAVISKGQSLLITLSSVVSAASTFLVTWLATRSLPVEAGKDYLVFWSLTSLVFATLLGVQQESARLIGAARLPETDNAHSSQGFTRSPTATEAGSSFSPMVVAALVGLTCAAIFAAFTPVWLGTVLPEGEWHSVLLIAAVTSVYACHVFCIGASAGTRAWTEYALLISTGGVFCLLLTALAAVADAGLLAFQLAFLATAFLWIFFLPFSSKVRLATKIRLAGSGRSAYSGMMLAVGTAVAMAAMSVGFPVFLEATTSTAAPHDAALLAAIILGISITRAPIMLPLQAFQGVAVAYFLAHAKRPTVALFKPVAALLALGLIGGIAAFFLGPWLFDLIYSTYAGQLSGTFLGALTFAGALLAITTLSGTAALAMNAHRIYLGGWVATVLVAFGCLLLPLDLEARTLVSLLVSPLVGLLVHLWGMEGISRKQASTPALEKTIRQERSIL